MLLIPNVITLPLRYSDEITGLPGQNLAKCSIPVFPRLVVAWISDIVHTAITPRYMQTYTAASTKSFQISLFC